jgi:hypothetical protein
MAKPPPLRPSKEKIKRAQSKFDYLKSGINRYLASSPYAIKVEANADFRYIIASRTVDPPDDFAFEVTEAVGHLRSALDKMIVALVDKNGFGTSGVGFPFGGLDNGKPEQFPSTRMERGIKKKLTPEQWGVIEAQRPYPGGNDALWAINEIANEDKHRAGLVQIRPAMSDRGGIGVVLGGGLIREITYRPNDCDFVLKDKEREVVLLRIREGGLNEKIDTTIACSVVFGDIRPVAGKNVLTTLNEQIRITERIVDIFGRAFF